MPHTFSLRDLKYHSHSTIVCAHCQQKIAHYCFFLDNWSLLPGSVGIVGISSISRLAQLILYVLTTARPRTVVNHANEWVTCTE
jgi:hypothetical protein